MSEPTPPTKPTGSKDEGISKYMKRMKTVLRGGTRSNRNSVSNTADITGDPNKAKTTIAASSTKPVATTKTTTPKKATPTSGQVKVHSWSTMQEEKARALFAKYGLTLEPGEWVTPRSATENVERVEKPIRLRVRRNCHRCLTTFGPERICVGCSHVRCKKCFRYPPAKPKDESEEKPRICAIEKAQKAELRPKKAPLTIPSRTGGQDLVRKPIMQRVRRTCHKCSTLFIGNATECLNCNHIRCKRCPRDPPKKFKPEPDPELLRRVEEKLAAIDVS
ncbi:hypothetical protein PRK78_003168 [Emydomyces testavorans]|uniref:Uncharacterized protein n=1 Tax=Emydomyces testavorans TaxID=2070801 RepID=A0AAF0III3_9EURO|nr:hypothetical protein PRK78_003168 [Emydomyces testavorans]